MLFGVITVHLPLPGDRFWSDSTMKKKEKTKKLKKPKKSVFLLVAEKFEEKIKLTEFLRNVNRKHRSKYQSKTIELQQESTESSK